MTSRSSKDWRRLLESCLAALYTDARRRAEFCLSGSEVQLLEEYGTDGLRDGLARAITVRRDSIANSGLPTYDVIEESAHDVIVQVTSRTRWPHGMTVPFHPMRVYLIDRETGWQVADIFSACYMCNRPAREDVEARDTPGKCFLCGGSGAGGPRSSEGKCVHCGGTGRCPNCTEEEMPGWFRGFTLDGLTERI